MGGNRETKICGQAWIGAVERGSCPDSSGHFATGVVGDDAAICLRKPINEFCGSETPEVGKATVDSPSRNNREEWRMPRVSKAADIGSSEIWENPISGSFDAETVLRISKITRFL